MIASASTGDLRRSEEIRSGHQKSGEIAGDRRKICGIVCASLLWLLTLGCWETEITNVHVVQCDSTVTKTYQIADTTVIDTVCWVTVPDPGEH